MTVVADRHETSCSEESPPKITTTFFFIDQNSFIIIKSISSLSFDYSTNFSKINPSK